MTLAAAVTLLVGVVVAVTSGAEQSTTAMDRLRAKTHASDILVSVGENDSAGLLEIAEAIPGVAAASTVRELFVRPKDSGLFPDFNLLTIAPASDVGEPATDVPLIVKGRAADETRIAEVTMSEALAASLGLHVGDQLVLESMTTEWVDLAFNGGIPGDPDGPEVNVQLVGLARSPADFDKYSGVLHLTAAFADRYEGEIRTYHFAAATLTAAAWAQVAAGEKPTTGNPDVELDFSANAKSKAVQDSLNTIAVALRLVSLVAGLAGLAIVGLLLARTARNIAVDRKVLVSIGWTRAEVARLSVLVPAPALGLGLCVGLVAGVFGSPLASFGFAAAVDPTSSAYIVRTGLLLFIALSVTATLAVLLALTARRAARASNAHRPTALPAPPLRHPLVVALGARRALFGSADGGGRLSRAAAATIGAGIALAVAVLLIGSSIQRLRDDPTLSGRGPVSEHGIHAGEDASVYTRAMAVMEADLRATNLLGFHVAFGITGPATTELTALVFDARRGQPSVSLLRGRVPSRPDEVAVGPASLKSMELDLGDEVELQCARQQREEDSQGCSSGATARFRIVGVMLFPEGDFQHDSGVAMTVGAFESLGGVDETALHGVVFQWAQSIDAVAADADLTVEGFSVWATTGGLVPPVVSNLGEVRGLAPLVAGLIFVLGVATVLYTVAMTGRLRRGETATLRALGATPRTLTATTEAHALALGMVGLIVGIPLGVVGGKLIWSQIADRAYVVDRPVVSGAEVWWLVAVSTIGLLLLAIPLAWNGVHRHSSLALRAE